MKPRVAQFTDKLQDGETERNTRLCENQMERWRNTANILSWGRPQGPWTGSAWEKCSRREPLRQPAVHSHGCIQERVVLPRYREQGIPIDESMAPLRDRYDPRLSPLQYSHIRAPEPASLQAHTVHHIEKMYCSLRNPRHEFSVGLVSTAPPSSSQSEPVLVLSSTQGLWILTGTTFRWQLHRLPVSNQCGPPRSLQAVIFFSYQCSPCLFSRYL